MSKMFETTLDSFKEENLAQTSHNFRARFLLLFTKELIKNSTEDFFKLEHEMKKRDHFARKQRNYIQSLMPIYQKQREETPPKIKETNQDPFFLSLIHKMPRPKFEQELMPSTKQVFNVELPQRPQQQRISRKPYRPLFIPENPLPPDLRYLQPYPTNIPVNLGKLEPLAQDPNVKIIECNGPDEPVTVKGNMTTNQTIISLSKEEIDLLLQNFFAQAKIPYHDGVHKVVLGQYILSAIVSEVIGSKFIIRKMVPQQTRPQMFGQRY
jgi:hypothetical protein